MKILNSSDSDFKVNFEELLRRADIDIDSVTPKVKEIILDVKDRKDEALIEHISKFDRWTPKSGDDLIISRDRMESAYNSLDSDTKKSLHIAYDRIKSYHEKQLPKSWIDFEDNGTILGQKVTPVQRAGLYIPGGKAFYPSSLLMNAIPALVAGVKEIVVTTPTPDEHISELLLASSYICNIEKLYRVGGASAISAMAYSTQTIPKVDVITGPGNIFVATAKKLVFGDVNIDMIAGPSEIGVLAGDGANSKYVAIDLLSQAEHDEMASSILITDSERFARETKANLYELLAKLDRVDIATESIEERGAIIVTKDIDEAIELMNEIAPEHLEILTPNPFEILPKIKNAGAIFLGENTPEAIGDYVAGPNHTLPTGGSAKFFSPLSVDNFLKRSSIISFSKEAIQSSIGKSAIDIASLEGLDAHRLSVEFRYRDFNS